MFLSSVALLVAVAVAETIIGIDLGTTYSCVAVSRNGQVEIIPNEVGNRITPSYVSFTETGERLVGDAAKNYAVNSPENTIFDVKRLVGRKIDDPEVVRDMKLLPYKIINHDGRPFVKLSNTNLPDELKGKELSPEEISSFILLKMKQIAEAYIGETVNKAVVTVPAYFNDAQRQATKDAGRIAGLEVVRIINEPTSSAIAYGLDKSTEKSDGSKNILVYDLGGGTFDVSLLSVDSGVFEVLATNGDTHLGGQDFDRRVMDYFIKVFKTKTGKDIAAKENRRALSRLRREVENAKRELSSTNLVNIELESLVDGVDFSEMLTRAKFEELNQDLFKKTMKPVEQVLADAKLKKSQIDELILVGGSTRIPKVRALLKDFFNGKALNTEINADEAVGFGAAVQGALLGGSKDHDILLIDVTPLSLGIETIGGVMTNIIDRNSYIPVKKSKTFSTVQDNQEMVRISVYEGERAMVKDNNLLGNFDLEDIPPMPKGQAQVEVTFELDSNGILTVSAVEKGSGKEHSITIKNDRGRLSEEEIERLVKEAEEFEEEDRKTRDKVEAKNAVDALLYSAKGKIDKDKDGNVLDKLKPADVKKLQQAIDDLEEWLSDYGADASADEFNEEKAKFEKVVHAVLGTLYEGGDEEEGSGYDKDEL